MKMNTQQWMAWLGSTVAAALTMAAYGFNTFEMKDNANLKVSHLEKRLDRIEAKVDQLLERRR